MKTPLSYRDPTHGRQLWKAEEWLKRRVLWICFDLSNGDGVFMHPMAKHYAWWFNTRKAAREHMDKHRKNAAYARLSGPFKYVRGREQDAR